MSTRCYKGAFSNLQIIGGNLSIVNNKNVVAHHQPEEEDDGPDGAAWEFEHHLRVGDEHEAWTRVHDLVRSCEMMINGIRCYYIFYVDPLVESHVSEDAEGDGARQQAGGGVDEAGDDRVSEISLVKLSVFHCSANKDTQ